MMNFFLKIVPILLKKQQFSPMSSGKRVLPRLADEEISRFHVLLLNWFYANRRLLPWRGDRPPYVGSTASGIHSLVKSTPLPHPSLHDGYATWVSEVMLQQTRVDAVIDAYLRWMAKFPTIESLARASDDEIRPLWAGLGFYNRCQNLHKGSQEVVEKFSGVLPSKVSDLLSIRGIGPYIAGAISSIAFDEPVPTVDGNIIRVFARLLKIEDLNPKDSKSVKDMFDVAAAHLDKDHPGDWNQALMEFGAVLCTPKKPNCELCPLGANGICASFEAGKNSIRLNSSLTSEVDIEDIVSTKESIESPPKQPKLKQVSLSSYFFKGDTNKSQSVDIKPASDVGTDGVSTDVTTNIQLESNCSIGETVPVVPVVQIPSHDLSETEMLAVKSWIVERYPLTVKAKQNPIYLVTTLCVRVCVPPSFSSSQLKVLLVRPQWPVWGNSGYDGLLQGQWKLPVRIRLLETTEAADLTKNVGSMDMEVPWNGEFTFRDVYERLTSNGVPIRHLGRSAALKHVFSHVTHMMVTENFEIVLPSDSSSQVVLLREIGGAVHDCWAVPNRAEREAYDKRRLKESAGKKSSKKGTITDGGLSTDGTGDFEDSPFSVGEKREREIVDLVDDECPTVNSSVSPLVDASCLPLGALVDALHLTWADPIDLVSLGQTTWLAKALWGGLSDVVAVYASSYSELASLRSRKLAKIPLTWQSPFPHEKLTEKEIEAWDILVKRWNSCL